MKFAKPPAYIRFLNALDTLDRLKPGKQLDGIEDNYWITLPYTRHRIRRY